jgi:hypothetical protein
VYPIRSEPGANGVRNFGALFLCVFIIFLFISWYMTFHHAITLYNCTMNLASVLPIGEVIMNGHVCLSLLFGWLRQI